MIEALKQFVAVVLSICIVCVGYACFAYWVYASEFSIVALLVGLVGFFITYNPAMELWKKTFNNLFGVKQQQKEENK